MVEPVEIPQETEPTVETNEEVTDSENEARKNFEDTLKSGTKDDMINARNELLQAQFTGKIAEAQIKIVEKVNVDAANALQDLNNQILEKINQSSTPSEAAGTLWETIKNGNPWTWKNGDAATKLGNDQAGSFLKSLMDEQGNKELLNDILGDININGGKITSNDPIIVERQVRNLNDVIEKRLNSSDEKVNNLQKTIEKIMEEQRTKKAESGEKLGPEKLDWKERLKLALKLLAAAGYIATAFILLQYMRDHSGCIYVQDIKGKDEQQQKISCYTDKDSNITEWGPINCVCSDPPATSFPPINNKTQCYDNKTLVDTVKAQEQKQCKGDGTGDDYRYYTYQIMSPLDAILNIGQKILPDPGKWGDEFLKILKWVGIFACIIVVLLIILAVVRHYTKNRE
jgi:hypothetical protein